MPIRRIPLFLAPENQIPGGVFGIGIVALKKAEGNPKDVICRLLTRASAGHQTNFTLLEIFVRYKNLMRSLSMLQNYTRKVLVILGLFS
jgi:hypothetical protein